MVLCVMWLTFCQIAQLQSNALWRLQSEIRMLTLKWKVSVDGIFLEAVRSPCGPDAFLPCHIHNSLVTGQDKVETNQTKKGKGFPLTTWETPSFSRSVLLYLCCLWRGIGPHLQLDGLERIAVHGCMKIKTTWLCSKGNCNLLWHHSSESLVNLEDMSVVHFRTWSIYGETLLHGRRKTIWFCSLGF